MAEKLNPISMPSGQVLAEFANYEDAVSYVNRLVEGDFPAAQIAIIGSNLSSVERVRGRLGYGRVALGGALTGVWIGLLFAILFGAGIEVGAEGQINYAPEQFLAAVAIGIGLGMMLNILRHALNKKRRNFVSAPVMVAETYRVQVPEAEAARAQAALLKQGE
jgi:hypothetical protein